MPLHFFSFKSVQSECQGDKRQGIQGEFSKEKFMNLRRATEASHVVTCENLSLPEKGQKLKNPNIHVPLWQYSYAVVSNAIIIIILE